MITHNHEEDFTPLRVMFVITSLHGGGAEYVARTWMSWLISRGYAVEVVATGGVIRDDFLPEGATAVALSPNRGHVNRIRELRGAISASHAHAVVSLQAYPNLLLVAAAALIRKSRRPAILISERNLVSLGLPGSSRSHRFKVWLAHRAYRRADHVIAISHPVAGELVSAFGVPGERLTVVPNPATAKVNARTTSRIRGTEAGIQLVIACRLVEQKRPLLAIETARELTNRGFDVEVVSFGGGPLLEMVREAARDVGVSFTAHGWVENWFENFAPNAVAILPSIREGFGNVLVEAAAAGYPSVAISGALGVADAIVPGITGELASSEDPRDVADAVVRAAELSLADIDPWLRRFSIEASGTDLERVISRTVLLTEQRRS